jgi:hypothetical protein
VLPGTEIWSLELLRGQDSDTLDAGDGVRPPPGSGERSRLQAAVDSHKANTTGSCIKVPFFRSRDQRI